MRHASLTPDEELNSLMYETFFCVYTYGSYKLLKTAPFWPTLYKQQQQQQHCYVSFGR